MSSKLALVRRLTGLLPALTIAACTHDGGAPQASLENTVQPRSQVMALAEGRDGPPQRAAARPRMVALPVEAGGVGKVTSRDYADGFRQDIALQGARVPQVGNGITLLARSERVDTLEQRVPLEKPNERAIRSEIGAAMPRIAMQIVESERSNAYGPYGLALGRHGADTRCAYMWQWIDANRLPRDAGLAGPASLRVRLCRNGVTFDDMAAWMDHLTIGPQPVSTEVAEAGIVSLPGPGEETHPNRRQAHAKLRRHHPGPAPQEARYLTSAAVAPAAVRSVQSTAYPVAAAAPAVKFGGDLPPQAFAGPSATSVPAASRP